MLPVSHVSVSADPFSALATVAYDPTLVAPVVDPNSPATFAHNVQLAQQTALRVHQLAQGAITGIERAYEPTTDPLQTASELQTLRETLLQFREFLAQTGVGALPMPAEPLTEQQLAVRNEALTRAQFQRLMGPKENAAIVASMLAAPDRR